MRERVLTSFHRALFVKNLRCAESPRNMSRIGEKWQKGDTC